MSQRIGGPYLWIMVFEVVDTKNSSATYVVMYDLIT